MSLLPPGFTLPDITENDIIIASIAWGFTLGFGLLTTWTAMRQTRVAYKNTGLRVLRNAYILMIWGEIIVCLAFSIICFLHIRRIIPPCFAFYFSILTLWALQVQFLLQIIINRCRIIALDKKFTERLKIGVAVLITAVNISVYTIWIPARLEISETYIYTNNWWDRVEKVIYLVTDACLNVYFIRVVQHGLVRNGLTKYRGLVYFNMFIIGFSLSMDVLIISMMSLPNTFVYMQFHPLAYIVKLNIELSMADLIGRIARSKDLNLTRNSSKLSPQRSKDRSIAETITDRWHNIELGGWNHRPVLTRPDAAYTVNATASASAGAGAGVDSAPRHSKDIYTTREFRVDFEEMASQSHGSVTPSNTASTSRNENEDTSSLTSHHRDYIMTDDRSP
ncbi:hypothetical protein E0Z10_g5379 [Xylaria hypoxylon]|uniref:Uncharacterized protein n=1 Tax=Xylaria hypoxylon TaxID=37992 RepID=A0A4Z0YW31_9PEZI|nr:hypothetical protein E0Z10_g5379 [Xylaria hypoxylon]